MVRAYTTDELLKVAQASKGFKGFPVGYWFIAIRGKAKELEFNDKIYWFKGETFIHVTTGTTHKGSKGTAVICSGIWNHDAYAPSDGKLVRHHKDKMRCLRQVAGIFYKRDGSDVVKNDIISVNYHANNYDLLSKIKRWLIGGWSEGCIVENDIPLYVETLDMVKDQKRISFVIAEET